MARSLTDTGYVGKSSCAAGPSPLAADILDSLEQPRLFIAIRCDARCNLPPAARNHILIRDQYLVIK
jgi:hypothetical protein